MLDFAARRRLFFFSTIFVTCIIVIAVAFTTVFLLKEAQLDYEKQKEKIDKTNTLTLQVQYAFKLQVQEWKNILLRGHEPESYEKYYASFLTQFKTSQQTTTELISLLSEDSNSIELAEKFKQQHSLILDEYKIALNLFTSSGFDAQLADSAVRGIDRAPDTLLSRLSRQLSLESESLHLLLEKELIEFKFLLSLVFFTIQGLLCIILVRLTGKMLSLSLTHKATGMGNRNYFVESINDCIRKSAKSTIAIIDFDEFKIINGTCGNSGGDYYLRVVCNKLSKQLGANGKVFSIGGDLIGLVIHLPHQQSLHVLKDISSTIADFEFKWKDIEISLTCSIASYKLKNKHTESVENVLDALYVGMQVTKENNINSLIDYNNEHKDIAWLQKQLRMVHKIRRILDKKRAVLYRQAISPLADSHKDTYYEVLLRLQNKNGEITPPGLFLQTAERFKLITEVDKYVITQLLHYLESAPNDVYKYSVNLSGQTLSDTSFIAFLKDILEHTPVDKKRLSFEITESDVIKNIDNALSVISCLRAYGCKVVLDDFGAGMSSYAYISDMQVSTIKIDGQFVANLPEKPQNKAIIKSIVALAKEMDLETVGEFVETEPELNSLTELQVDYGQGYYIHRPSLLYAPR